MIHQRHYLAILVTLFIQNFVFAAQPANPGAILVTIDAPSEVCMPENFQAKITIITEGNGGPYEDKNITVTGITCDYLPKTAKCPGETTVIISPRSHGKAKITCGGTTKTVSVITNNQTGDWTVVQTGRDPLNPTTNVPYNNGNYTDFLFGGGFIEYKGSGSIRTTYDYEEDASYKPGINGTACGHVYTEDFSFSAGMEVSKSFFWITVTISGQVSISSKKEVGEPQRHVRVKGVSPYQKISDIRSNWEARVTGPSGLQGEWQPETAKSVEVGKYYKAVNYRVEKKCCTE